MARVLDVRQDNAAEWPVGAIVKHGPGYGTRGCGSTFVVESMDDVSSIDRHVAYCPVCRELAFIDHEPLRVGNRA